MLTQKAIDFTPIIIEMTLWGDKYLRQFNKIDHIEGLDADKSEVIQIIKMRYSEMANVIENIKSE